MEVEEIPKLKSQGGNTGPFENGCGMVWRFWMGEELHMRGLLLRI